MFKITFKLDVDHEKPLFLCFIYPNGDELHIRRLYGDELKSRAPLKFLIVFIPLSTVKEWKSRAFPNFILKKVNDKTQITNNHQLICVAHGIPRDDFFKKYNLKDKESNRVSDDLASDDLAKNIEKIKII